MDENEANYELGKEAGYESAIELALEAMRKSRQELWDVLKAWTPDLRSEWPAVARVNHAGFSLWVDATTAGRLINLLKPLLQTKSQWDTELAELDDVFETLGSWDLGTSFGWLA